MAEDPVVSVDIAAPPERVWALVSDITRMPEWSPETYSAEWVGDARRAVQGARFKGMNRYGRMKWTTTAEIEVADAPRELTFVTIFGQATLGTRWRYRLEPRDGGTRLTESREVLSRDSPNITAKVLSGVVKGFEGLFMRGHEASLAESMRTTLERIRTAAEAWPAQEEAPAAGRQPAAPPHPPAPPPPGPAPS